MRDFNAMIIRELLRIFKQKKETSWTDNNKLTFNSDGLTTIHNSDFLLDSRFIRAYELAEQTNSWCGHKMQWRAYIAFWFAEQAKRLEGDFVECGVNKGGLARGIIEYTEFKNTSKKFFLFDTFNGFDLRYVSEQEKKKGILSIYSHHYPNCYNEVQKTFHGFNVQIVKGSVPDTLNQVLIEKVSFLSIDMNCLLPEVAALNFFWDKLVSGGVIVLDDYGFTNHLEQKKGHDQFAKDNKVSILSLPTGQGIIIKP